MSVTALSRQYRPRIRLTGARTSRDAYGYVRVSTNERNQLSIPAQMTLVEKAAEAAGYRIVGWYKDNRSRGVRREGMHSMLSDVEINENVGAVFFWQDTRMWGHIEQQRRIMARLTLAGVHMIDSKGKEWKDDTPAEKLMNIVTGGMSEYETGTTAVRVYDTHKEKVQAGQIITKPPHGVRIMKRPSDDGQSIVSTFVLAPEGMTIIRRIFNEYASGVAAWKIAKQLQDEGISTPRNASWSAVNIRRTLDNRFYIGELVWNRTKTLWDMDPVTGDKIKRVAVRPDSDVVTGVSPLGCILAEDPTNPKQVAEAMVLFNRCSEQRDTRGRERIARVYDLRVLAGLIICDRCGHQMQGRRVGHRLASGAPSDCWDFRCAHRTNVNTGCSKSHTMAERVIVKRLRDLLAMDNPNTDDRPTKWRPQAPSRTAGRAARAKADAELAKAKAQLQRVKDGWKEGVYDSGVEFREEKAKASVAVQAATLAVTEASTLDTAEPPTDLAMSEAQREVMERLLDVMFDEGIPLEMRREMAADLIYEIRVDNPSVTVVLR